MDKVEKLIDQLGGIMSDTARLNAATELGEIGDTRAVIPLIDYLEWCKGDHRRTIIEALGKLGDAKAVEPLIAFLGYRFIFSSERAKDALRAIGKAGEFEPFVKALKNEKRHVRRIIADILEENGWKPSKKSELVHYLIAAEKWDELPAVGEPAVKPLIDALGDKNKSIRSNIIKALGEIGSPKAAAPLIRQLECEETFIFNEILRAFEKIIEAGTNAPFIRELKDKNRFVRRTAAKILEKTDWKPSTESERVRYLIAAEKWDELPAVGKAAIKPLIDTLDDKKASIRKCVIKTLAEIGSPKAVLPLIRRLEHEERSIIKKILRALEKMNKAGIAAPFIDALKNEDFNFRLGMADVLGKIGWKPSNNKELALFLIAKQEWDKLPTLGKDAVEPLIYTLEDADDKIRNKAVETLSYIHPPREVELLINALKDDSIKVRQTAVETLSKTDDPGVTAALIRALKDEKVEVRGSAAEALGNRGDPEAVEPLINALKEDSIYVRSEALKALEKMGTAALDFFITALQDKKPFVREKAANLLGKIGDPKAIKPLITLLDDGDSFVREEAVRALGLIGGAPAVESLMKALGDKEPSVQIEAAVALGKIGDIRAMELLIDKIKNTNPAREKAVEALGEIGDARAVEPLLIVLKDGRTEGTKEALDRTASRLFVEDYYFICRKCLLRYKQFKTKILSSEPITYCACPKCHSDSFYWSGIKKIVFLLDNGFQESSVHKEETLIVNWFKREELFDRGDLIDYDEIRLEDADDYEVEKLVMILRNDMNNERRKHLPKIPVHLSSHLALSTAKINMLKDNFETVING